LKTLTVALGTRAYPLHIGEGAIAHLPETLTQVGASGTLALVTDTNVGPLYAEQVAALAAQTGAKVITSTMPAGEEHKRLARLDELTAAFLKARLDRTSVIIALGGGVVGDVAGFAAAAYMRGVRYVQIPTTIVAQVDSSVGGKTGVNHPLGKNILGAFHQPSAVIIDLAFLKTLPEREVRAGLAEVIKHGVIADAELFYYMEETVDGILGMDLQALEYPIVRSCEIKSAIVAEDETEQGKRANLNYGHTFGHGIEAVTHYKQFLHGEAIALGMHAAAHLAHDLGLVDTMFVERQRSCLERYGLPAHWPDLPVDETLALMQHDKKARGGMMKFVVPDAMGHVVHRTDVTEDQARRALAAVRDGR
jgi:3-dehydroquinate synthase